MQKFKLLLLSGLLTLALTACGSQTEPETFQQGNIMTLYGSVMETDYAYYYTTNDFGYELHYYDKASGKSIFLCNKPECSHDGNEFCAATAGGRFVMYSALYEDGIYIAALERADNRIDKKLFKVSLDGTKLETICTFGYDPASDLIAHGFEDKKYMAVYKGKAFIPCQTQQNDGSSNYSTAIVDIASGKVTYLEEHNSFASSGQKKYIPYEDYLYYYVSDRYGGASTLYRYHLSKKTTEEIPVPKDFTDYCIVEGAVVYTRTDEDGFCHIYSLHPDTLETKDLTGPLTKEDGTPLLKEWEGELLFDGEYLVTYTGFYEGNKGDRYFIISKDGTFLTSLSRPDGIDEGADICILNGYVYFRDYYSMVRCSVQDILNGNIEWTTLFVTAERENE